MIYFTGIQVDHILKPSGAYDEITNTSQLTSETNERSEKDILLLQLEKDLNGLWIIYHEFKYNEEVQRM